MAPVLSVRKMWVGFDKSVEGAILVIANKGMPTEQRWAVGPWCAIEAGVALAKRGAMLLRKTLFAESMAIEVEEGAERPNAEQVSGLN